MSHTDASPAAPRRRVALGVAGVLLAAAVGATALAGAPAAPAASSPWRTALALVGDADAGIELNVTRWDLVTQAVGDDVDAAAARTLITRSMLAGSDEELDDVLGWTVTDLEFEAFLRAPTGDVVVAGLGPGLAPATVEDSLAGAGFEAAGDVFTPTTPTLPPALLSQFAHVAVDTERALLFAARDRSALDAARAAVTDRRTSRAWQDVTAGLADSVTALVRTADLECQAVVADADSADAAENAARAAGGTRDPLLAARGIELAGTGSQEGGDVQIIAHRYADPGIARDQARVRQRLATGPFIGRQGRIEDALTWQDTRVEGAALTLRFGIDSTRAEFMSGGGPLQIAWCARVR